MTTIPRTKVQLTVIEGGKPDVRHKDPIVKLRFDPPPPDAPRSLTAEEIADLKVLNGVEDKE